MASLKIFEENQISGELLSGKAAFFWLAESTSKCISRCQAVSGLDVMLEEDFCR